LQPCLSLKRRRAAGKPAVWVCVLQRRIVAWDACVADTLCSRHSPAVARDPLSRIHRAAHRRRRRLPSHCLCCSHDERALISATATLTSPAIWKRPRESASELRTGFNRWAKGSPDVTIATKAALQHEYYHTPPSAPPPHHTRSWRPIHPPTCLSGPSSRYCEWKCRHCTPSTPRRWRTSSEW
jgi:hypothetical protein